MKQLIILMLCLFSLSACIVLPGETFLPVEQAALRSKNKGMRQAVEYIEPLLAAGGFRSEGTYLEMENAEIRRSYDGPSDSSAALEAKDGCISFITFVKDGTQNYIAPRAVFKQVLDQLERDDSWEIRRGEIC